MLKALGYWITGLHEETLPAPQELVGAMPADQRARLADYLIPAMLANDVPLVPTTMGVEIDIRLTGATNRPSVTSEVNTLAEAVRHIRRVDDGRSTLRLKRLERMRQVDFDIGPGRGITITLKLQSQ